MELEELTKIILEVDRKYISERGTYYHAEQTAKALMEKIDPVATVQLQRGVSKTFCCRDCGEKVTYENMAAYKINYKMDKEGNRATGATMEMICIKCFYKESC